MIATPMPMATERQTEKRGRRVAGSKNRLISALLFSNWWARPRCVPRLAMTSSMSLTGTQLSRPQVVKKLWEHIKANDLQDPNDKRQIRCDDKMQAVFERSRVDMFQMNKLLGNQLYPIEE